MPTPAGYMTKSEAIEYIREKTGYGSRAITNKMEELEAAEAIHFLDHPGHRQAKLLRVSDVEKVVAALTMPP